SFFGAVAAVAFDGTVFRAFFRTAEGVRMTRFTSAGEILDPGGIVVAQAASIVRDVRCDGDGSCLVLSSNEDGIDPAEVQIAHYDADGAVLEAPVSFAGYDDGRFDDSSAGRRALLSSRPNDPRLQAVVSIPATLAALE